MPKVKNNSLDVMVVEGYIDGVNGTTIQLTRAKNIGPADSSYQKYVTDASVTVENEQGAKFPLSNYGNGTYNGNYNFDPSVKYRIHIVTADDKEYVSAFVIYKASPAIDSISYKYEEKGARFSVSTHDNTGQSKYYRWKYEETWKFHSLYISAYKYDPYTNKVVDNDKEIYDCWQSSASNEILINNSANLNQDVIREMPLVLIPNGSFKLSDVYSIKVTQFAMDSVGYNYYRQLKKNTEETGGIFDPQPGNLRGNIRNINDTSEIVVGYIGAGNSYEIRQFFKIPWNFKWDCSPMITVPNLPDSLAYYFGGGDYWPVNPEYNGPALTGWTSAPSLCTDCTRRGTNIKPPFWP